MRYKDDPKQIVVRYPSCCAKCQTRLPKGSVANARNHRGKSKMLVDLMRLIPNYSENNSFRMRRQLIKKRINGQRRWWIYILTRKIILTIYWILS